MTFLIFKIGKKTYQIDFIVDDEYGSKRLNATYVILLKNYKLNAMISLGFGKINLTNNIGVTYL